MRALLDCKVAVAEAFKDIGPRLRTGKLRIREPARLRLLDDADLNAVDQRQAAPAQVRSHRLRVDISVRRDGIEELLAKSGVALKHDARAPSPRLEPERPGAHRMRHDLVAVQLDHFACHRAAKIGAGQDMHEARIGLGQHHFEAVAVERAQPAYRLVIRKCLFVLLHATPQLRQAQQLGVLELVRDARCAPWGRNSA